MPPSLFSSFSPASNCSKLPWCFQFALECGGRETSPLWRGNHVAACSLRFWLLVVGFGGTGHFSGKPTLLALGFASSTSGAESCKAKKPSNLILKLWGLGPRLFFLHIFIFGESLLASSAFILTPSLHTEQRAISIFLLPHADVGRAACGRKNGRGCFDIITL